MAGMAQLAAPTGRRVVATGGAARPQCGPTRNPWKADEGKGVGVFPPFFAPAGRRGFLGRRKDAYARCFLRPFGADVLKHDSTHGLRTARRAAARRGTRGKRMREKGSGFFPPFFAPAGRRRFLGRRKDACARPFLRPWRGGCVITRSRPRVAHRPPCGGRCFTRGHSPPPRWGGCVETRTLPQIAPPGVPARRTTFAAAAGPSHVQLSGTRPIRLPCP